MKDLRTILLTGLIPALATATGLPVRTRISKGETVAPPYIFVGDIYDKEIGPKTSFIYEYDVQLQVVYCNLKDLQPLYDTMNNIKSIINNRTPFTLSGGHVIDSMELTNSNTNDFETETGIEHLGVIRLLFYIR